MLNMGSATGVQILPDKMVLVNVRKGFQDFSVRQSAVLEGFRDAPVAEMRSKLRQLLQNGAVNPENLVLGLPSEEVTLRLIELPIEVEENLDQVVRFQVEKFEPSEEESSYYDYVVLSRDESQKKILLQLAMVRQNLLDGYLALLKDLGLAPSAVRLSSLALHQLLALHKAGFPKKEPVVILDVNPGSVEMVVVLSSERFFAEKLDIRQEELEGDRIIRELYDFLSRLPVKAGGIARIYVSGSLGSETLEQLRQRLADCELLVDALRVKGWTRSAELAPAIGLAATALSKSRAAKINLIPPEQRVIARKPSIVPTAVLVCLFLVMAVMAGTREYKQGSRFLNRIDSEVAQLQPQIDEVLALKKQVEEKQKELDEIRGLMQGEQTVLSVLKDLTELLPDDTYLQNLNIERGQVVLFGFTGSAGNLIPALRASDHFKSVLLKYTTKDRATGKEKFNIEAALKTDESQEQE
ncbi:MAG TPA: PilN domain-containing protein [Acidobacteriota bacterium]|jgi:general secretion pathway protein L|nr:PilN domain-containing protein [Acidobacteriota bacterium]